MKSCKQVTEALDRIIDGDVTSWQRLLFALHLAVCRNCERYFRQYKAVRDAAGATDAELPDDFNDVMGKVVASALAKADDGG